MASGLIDKILKFRNARDWEKFHTPRNLASSLVIEASELLEIFQWKKDDNLSSEDKKALAEELADVYYYLLLLSHDTNINLAKALEAKMKLNKQRYPVKLSKGNSIKYTKLK